MAVLSAPSAKYSCKNKKNYNLIGWLIKDELGNEINFSLKIEKINDDIDKNYFKIPSLN